MDYKSLCFECIPYFLIFLCSFSISVLLIVTISSCTSSCCLSFVFSSDSFLFWYCRSAIVFCWSTGSLKKVEAFGHKSNFSGFLNQSWLILYQSSLAKLTIYVQLTEQVLNKAKKKCVYGNSTDHHFIAVTLTFLSAIF